jgi:dTMP kinase
MSPHASAPLPKAKDILPADMAHQPSAPQTLFITLEGGEGAGKSTLQQALALALISAGHGVELCREPGGTKIGEALRHILLSKTPYPASDVDLSPAITAPAITGAAALCPPPWDPLAEMLVFAAARAQLLSEKIRPALLAGKWVICDRFSDSSLAYQSYAGQVPLDLALQINQMVLAHCTPDLTLLLDIPAEKGLARAKGRTADFSKDRFESRNLAFHNDVRQGFLTIAAQNPSRYLILDASLAPTTLLNHTLQHIGQRWPHILLKKTSPHDPAPHDLT